MIGEAAFDEPDHLTRRLVRRKAQPSRRNSASRQALAVLRVIVPFAACGLIALHQDFVLAPQFAIEMLHPPAATPARPVGEPGAARKEAIIGADLDRRLRQRRPPLDLRLHAPFRRFGHHDAARPMPRNCALDFGREAAGIAGRVEIYVVDRHAALTQRICEMPHRRQHQHDLLLVMPDIGAFLHHLHHQDGVAPGIEARERSHVERKMVAEDNSKRAHGCAAARTELDRSGASRQRCEQYFTFSQSRAHFLRQAKGRLQTGACLCR